MKDLDRIYRDNFIKVYRYILSVSGDEHLAEEITQETFYRALRKLESFRGECSVTTWLCRIARNILINHGDRAKRKNVADEELSRRPMADNSAEDSLIQKETGERIAKAMRSLEEPYGEVIALRLYSELPFNEIGQMFGKSDSWARVVYHRARMKMKEELKYECEV